MKEISIKEAKNTYAGGLSAGIYAAIAAGISVIIGLFDGQMRSK